jgi:two-component system, NtrC family, sensor kinase
MPCPRCQHQNRPQAKFCEECATPLNGAHLHRPPGSHADPTEKVDGLRRALSAALEQQTATSDILRVISSSPTDVQPVFDAIAQSAARLCEAQFCFVYRFDGQVLHFMAHHGVTNEGAEAVRRTFPAPPSRGSAAARAVLDCSVAQIPDVRLDSDFALRPAAMLAGYRSAVAVPMMRGGLPIGAIAVGRAQTGLSPDWQVNLLKTFADQAVIAIENVRLFKELEARNRDLTATSEILRVISRSPTDVQPVFDAIAHSASRLCEAFDVVVLRVQENVLHLVAHHGPLPVVSDVPLHRRTLGGRTMIERRVIHILDLQAEVDEFPEGSAIARVGGHRTTLSVPLLREGVAIGNIQARRQEVRPFTDTQISLLTTFADQAVIAIENVRLFKELEARNAELTDTLARQTATGEVLRAISRAQTDAQPVFDIIAESAQRLCGAGFGQVALYDGASLHMTAFHNVNPEGVEALRRRFPAPADRGSAMGRALETRAVVQIPDVLEDPTYAFKTELQTMGFQSLLVVPMLRKDEPIGAIAVGRLERGAFPDKQIELLQTFADQAVIAIENVRLFKELEARTADLTRSVGELTALSEISQVLSSTLDLGTVLRPSFRAPSSCRGWTAGWCSSTTTVPRSSSIGRRPRRAEPLPKRGGRRGFGGEKGWSGRPPSRSSPPKYLTSPSPARTTVGCGGT